MFLLGLSPALCLLLCAAFNFGRLVHNVPTEYTVEIVVAQFSPPLLSSRNVAASVFNIVVNILI